MRLYSRERLEPGGEPRQHKSHEKYRCGRTAHGELLEDSLRAKALQLSADVCLDGTLGDPIGRDWVRNFDCEVL